MTADNLLEQISHKLSVLIALQIKSMGANYDFAETERGKRGVGDLARYLANMGLDAKEIAQIVGAPLPSIRTLLTPSRKK